MQTLPNSCELCIRYKKTEPKSIVGNFNMVSVTSGSNSGISKKSLYKPAPKKKTKAKHTNRKPLAQSQLVDLNNPRSAKICKNGMKSLLTLERNFLSPDVQRRETICTPGKASISCRQYDAEVDDRLSETMNEKENRNKEDSVAKVICHAQRSCLSRKSPLFNVVTLSYFLLQNLCPTEIKRKREKNC